VKPHAQEWDREERFPKEVVEHIGQLGLLGMTVPEELGGSALDTLSVACVVEEIARWDGSLALTVASHTGLGTSHLLRFGSDDLRRRYIPEIAAGRKLAAWALTEPGSGSDAAGMRTTAVRKDKGWSSTARRCSSPRAPSATSSSCSRSAIRGSGRKA